MTKKDNNKTFDLDVDNAIEKCFKLEHIKNKKRFFADVEKNLKKKGYNNITVGKTQTIGKKIDIKRFNAAFDIIEEALYKMNTVIYREDYDGIIVKKLANHNLNTKNKTNQGKKSPNKEGGSGQSDIRPTKEQWQMFPHLTRSDDYINDPNLFNSLLSYYILEIPITLKNSNLEYLKHGKSTNNEQLVETHTTVLRNKQFMRISSQNTLNGDDFNDFRDLLGIDDFLVILKKKAEKNEGKVDEGLFSFEAYGIKSKSEDGELIQDETKLNSLDDCFIYLNTITILSQELFKKVNVYEDSQRLESGRNVIYYGVPGSGKSYRIKEYLEKKDIDESQCERVIFHPDYTYSDFVGQILPKVENDNPKYEFSPGPFTLILDKAFHNPKKEYFLIIEEINRGNAPAIFGDIFQLLDRVDDNEDANPLGTSEYAISNADLSTIYNEGESRLYGHKVRIPSNLSIFATMNTSDQNVFTLDTAFQRRWNMKMVINNLDKDKLKFTLFGTNVKWNEFCKGINDLIIERNKHGLSSEDKRLGAYFIKEKDLIINEDDNDEEFTLFREIFKHYLNNKNNQIDIEQYIKEKFKERKIKKIFAEKVLKYLWDDAFKFDRDKIFDKEEVEIFTLEYFINEFANPENNDCFSIFTDKVRLKIGLEEKSNKGKEDAE